MKPAAVAFVLATGLVLTGHASGAATIGMDARVFRAIDEVHQLLDQQSYDRALERLEKLRESRLSAYERAQLLRLLGVVHYETGRFPEARAAYEEALQQPKLPQAMIATLHGTLGRLGLIMNDNAYAERHLRALLAIPRHDTAANQVLLGNALLRQDRFADALAPLRNAIEEERAAGRVPQESSLSMLASAYHGLEDYESMRAMLRELVTEYPRVQYLMNLAALHGQLGDRERQLALIEAIFDDDKLQQASQLRMLADLFLSAELPYKAAVLLEREIDAGRIEADQRTLERLSQAWLLAEEGERALAPLERAAEMAETGDLFLRLAGLHLDAYRWQQAERAAARALEQGKLTSEGNAWLLRGMASARMGQLDAAARHFTRAAEFDDSRAYAAQWQAYVTQERQVAASMHADTR